MTDEKNFKQTSFFLPKCLNVIHYHSKQNKSCITLRTMCLYFQMNRAKLSYWKVTLLNVCNLINNMNNQVGETVEVDDEDLISGRQFPAALDGFSLEAMLTVYQLQKVCHSRAFQHWEVKWSVTSACFHDCYTFKLCSSSQWSFILQIPSVPPDLRCSWLKSPHHIV